MLFNNIDKGFLGQKHKNKQKTKNQPDIYTLDLKLAFWAAEMTPNQRMLIIVWCDLIEVIFWHHNLDS